MDNNIHFGDGVLDEAKADVNSRTKGLIKIAIDTVFDYLEGKAKDIPETIEQLRNSPETEQRIAALWSEHLFEEDLVPKGYNGLTDNLLISNFHQEGYLDGLYVGYVLAMMALTDNDAPKDITLAARDYIRPNLIRCHYDEKDEIINQYQNEKYRWIDKT
ncbi:hypothetical protein [Mediterraneibacter agrestimuris]|uniref:hypothetical protein n=1 Tax=Mediterraneibacter agrestimuris TaxID=2941333 RepID=UPI00203ADEBE|nr:hypothetical protein [Mediterraneibacter agrestimuris]